jgi:hypothetical protein
MMETGNLNLFDYATRFVTTGDVAAFAPGDPGYRDYVRAFNRILTSHELPAEPTSTLPKRSASRGGARRITRKTQSGSADSVSSQTPSAWLYVFVARGATIRCRRITSRSA